MTRPAAARLGACGVCLTLWLLGGASPGARAESPSERPPHAPPPLILKRPEPGSSPLGGGAPALVWPGVCITLALAVIGVASWASRRYRPMPGQESATLRVVARTAISTRHAVVLLRAGDRLLIVGTGPAGPPALLGEVPSPARGGEA